MIKNAKSLMDKSRNIAQKCNITTNEVLQNYMFERIGLPITSDWY